MPGVNILAGITPVEGGTTGTFTVTLDSPAPVGGLTVNITLAGTATLNTDYTVTAGSNIAAVTGSSFTIAAGQTSAILNVNAVTDTVSDPNETVTLILTTGTGYQLASDTFATLTIADTPPLNAAPVLTAPTAINYTDTVFDDTFATATGILIASDTGSATLTYSITGGTDQGSTISKSSAYGVLTLTKATGAYSFAPNDAALEALTAAASAGFTLSVSDGALSDSKTLTVNIAQTQNGTTESIDNDTLTGTSGNDKFNGLAGADILNGGPGADTMTGGDGSDIYYVDNIGDNVIEDNPVAGTGGTDIVYSYLPAYTLTTNVEKGRILATGAANLTGNILNNILYASSADNILDGDTGIDTASYQYGATFGVTVSLAVATIQATGGSDSDTLLNIENLIGSNYDDHLTGNSGNNILSGGIGNDRLEGGAGNDVLNGGTGADIMTGGDGSDLYYIDNLGDSVSEANPVASTGGTDFVYSYLTDYTLTTNVENGRILAAGSANLTGNTLNNILYASSADNILDGNTGIDTVSYQYGATTGVTVSLAVATIQATGGSGSDTLLNIENLVGSNYDDNLTGDSGNNILTGGAGLDILTGGSGNDFFDFNAFSELGLGATRDVITDFTSGRDKIDLSTIDADASLAGNQAFALVTNFTAVGQISYGGGIISFNTDADVAAEYEIQLTGVVPASLAATDFVL